MDSQVLSIPPFRSLSSTESLETISTYESLDTSPGSSAFLSVSEFFTDEQGRNLLFGQVGHLSFNGPTAMPSLSPTPTLLSVDTVLPSFDVLPLPLSQLCELVDCHRSLQRAETISSEAYTERIGAIIHRFLLLELRREGKKPIWLRLERTRSKSVGVVEFLLARGSTPANDIAKLAATKAPLVGDGVSENRQVFTTVPTLGELRHFLGIICDELQRYELWPANCWFFVSLLQQHLAAAGDGSFSYGSLPHPTLAQEIREKVNERSRLLYHMPTSMPSVASRLLSSLKRIGFDEADGMSGIFDLVVRWDDAPYHASQEARTLVARILPHISRASENIQNSVEICNLWKLFAHCIRQAYQQDSGYYCRFLADVLFKYGQSLHDLGEKGILLEDPIPSVENAVNIRRRLYAENPDREAYKFAQELQLYANLLCSAGLPGERAVRGECVAVLRILYTKYPDRYAIEVSRSLLSYARGLSDAGDEAAALIAYNEVESIIRRSYDKYPDIHLSHHVTSLREYKNSLIRSWHIHDAMVVSTALVRLLKMQYQRHAALYNLEFAIGLVDHARLLFENMTFPEALSASGDVVAFCALRRRPWLGQPSSEEARLAKLLYHLARQAAAARRYAIAFEIVQEALELCTAQRYRHAWRTHDLSARLSQVLSCAGPTRMARRARKLGLPWLDEGLSPKEETEYSVQSPSIGLGDPRPSNGSIDALIVPALPY